MHHLATFREHSVAKLFNSTWRRNPEAASGGPVVTFSLSQFLHHS